MAWQPLLSGRLAARADEAIRAIAADLARHAARRSLAPGGEVGPALFYAYLARAGRGGEELAESYLEHAVDSMTEAALPAALHGGFVGVAWAVEHLCSPPEDRLDEDARTEPGAPPRDGAARGTVRDAGKAAGGPDAARGAGGDPLGAAADVDAVLMKLLAPSPWAGHRDLLAGLVGIGVYALERRRRPDGDALLEAVVARLLELVEPAGGEGAGLALWTPPALLSQAARERHPDGQLDFGVSHGIAAAISFLASIDGEPARRARHGLATRLAAARRPSRDGSLYPPMLARGDAGRSDPAGDARCRAAWCYGDPGIAAALLRGGRAAGDARLEELGQEAAGAAAARTAEDAGVVDAGLCHGSAGLLHVMNRLAQATGDGAARTAAIRWAEDVLDRRAGGGVGGFRAYHPNQREAWVDDPTLLTGAAGVGLALLAATTDVPPDWDALLLCDVAPA